MSMPRNGGEMAGVSVIETLTVPALNHSGWDLPHGLTPRDWENVVLQLDYQTLRNYAWVARRFPAGRRRAGVSFAHHAEVARLPEPEQDYWLRRAEDPMSCMTASLGLFMHSPASDANRRENP